MHPVEEYQAIRGDLDCRGLELSAKLWRSQEEEWTSNYYITPATGSSSQLEVRCCTENQHPSEVDLRTPDWAVEVQSLRWVGENMLEWGPFPREARPPGPRLSSPGERERNAVMSIRVGVQYVAVLFSLQLTSHTVKPLVILSNPFK